MACWRLVYETIIQYLYGGYIPINEKNNRKNNESVWTAMIMVCAQEWRIHLLGPGERFVDKPAFSMISLSVLVRFAATSSCLCNDLHHNS